MLYQQEKAVFEAAVKYGPPVLLLFVFIEYLNIPCYVGGAAIPALGALVKLGGIGRVAAFSWAFFCAELGILAVYWACRAFQKPIAGLIRSSPRMARGYDRMQNVMDRYGAKGLLISRAVPVARTMSSIPAGILGYPFLRYALLSVPGTAVYVIVNLAAGYYAAGLFTA